MRTLCCLLTAAMAVSSQTPTRPRITGAAHVAINSADLAKTRAFYKDWLGCGEPFELKEPSGKLSLTFIKINDRQYIEVFPEKDVKSDRLNHVSVETDDIEAMRRYLGSKGLKVPDRLSRNRIRNMSFSVKDPDGHTVEFVQYLPGSETLRAKGKFAGPERISGRMAHFGILVGELEAAMKFYRDTLGFRETWRGSRDGKVLNWVNMEFPDGGDYIEFMLYDRMPPPDQRGTQHHICLLVPDLDRARARLEANPWRKNYARPLEIRTGVNRKRQMNLYDPDGTRVELMEPHTVDGNPAPSSAAPPPR